MDLREIVPGLHLVRLPGTNTHALNAYVWLGEDGVTLVDTGSVGSAPLLAEALAVLGRGPGDVRTIVLTHFHEDHTGSAAALTGWGDVTVAAGRADAAVIRGEQPGPAPRFTEAERQLFAQVSAGLPPAPPCRVDLELDDGDHLDVGGGAVVVGVPGHTPGSVALHWPRHRLLLTGDSVAESNGQVLLGPFNVDREAAWESLRRQAALDVDIACFGHGEPVLGDAARALRGAVDPFA